MSAAVATSSGRHRSAALVPILLATVCALTLPAPFVAQRVDSVALALRLNREAGELARQGRLDEAIERARRALALTTQIRGRRHRDVAADLFTLASFYAAKGDYFNAEPLLDEAIEIDKALFGPSHPEVAVDLIGLGKMLAAKPDVAGARAAYEAALPILFAAITDTTLEDYKLAEYMGHCAYGARSLGDLYFAGKQYDLAFQHFLQAEQLYEIVDRQRAIALLTEMAEHKRALGDYKTARIFLGRAETLSHQ